MCTATGYPVTNSVPADRPSRIRLYATPAQSRGDRMQSDQLKRREFITLLGSAAAAWPLAARAQQARLPTVGFLGANNATFERASTDAFVQRLRDLGWIENRTGLL